MILLKSLPDLIVLSAKRSILVVFIYFQLLLVLFTTQISLSFPMESFVFEKNPVQKLSFQYNQDGSTRPIRIKLQAISFKINEQLPRLDVQQDSMQKSAETKLNKKEELRELEKKFHPLSRFSVFYNTSEIDLVSNNVANKDIQQVNSKTDDQTEIEGSHSDNNTNTKDSKTTDRKENFNSVKVTRFSSEDETTESKQELSANIHGIEINKEKINSFIGTTKNEYQTVTKKVSVQDVTELAITTETMLETENMPTESYENLDKEAYVIKSKENNERDYKFTYKINNVMNIDRRQTAESITIKDLQSDIYDNITTEGYTQTEEYEESGNITETEKPFNK